MASLFMKLYRAIKFFFVYRKNVLKNRQYLEEKYGLNVNLLCELYTTITLADAPQELIQKFGKNVLAQQEVKKYIKQLNSDLPKLELDELVNLYEAKRVDDDNIGIAFGYSLANNTVIILSMIVAILAALAGLVFGVMSII